MIIRILKKTPLRIAFGKIVRRLREDLFMSQENLAEKANLNTNYVGSIERGERNVGLEVIYRLAYALKVHPRSLLPDPKKMGKVGIQEEEMD